MYEFIHVWKCVVDEAEREEIKNINVNKLFQGVDYVSVCLCVWERWFHRYILEWKWCNYYVHMSTRAHNANNISGFPAIKHRFQNIYAENSFLISGCCMDSRGMKFSWNQDWGVEWKTTEFPLVMTKMDRCQCINSPTRFPESRILNLSRSSCSKIESQISRNSTPQNHLEAFLATEECYDP